MSKTPKTVSVYIIKSPFEPLQLRVDGSDGIAKATVKVGVDTPLDERLLPVLETSQGVEWRYTNPADDKGRPPAVTTVENDGPRDYDHLQQVATATAGEGEGGDETKGSAKKSAPKSDAKSDGDGGDGKFDADAVIEGNVADVTERLGELTDDELEAVRAAEEDREKPRKGVQDAIDAEVAKRGEASNEDA